MHTVIERTCAHTHKYTHTHVFAHIHIIWTPPCEWPIVGQWTWVRGHIVSHTNTDTCICTCSHNMDTTSHMANIGTVDLGQRTYSFPKGSISTSYATSTMCNRCYHIGWLQVLARSMSSSKGGAAPIPSLCEHCCMHTVLCPLSLSLILSTVLDSLTRCYLLLIGF